MQMLKPDRSPEEEPEMDAPDDLSPSFEDLMLLVFSGPMCFECLDDAEEVEEESDEQEKSARSSTIDRD